MRVVVVGGTGFLGPDVVRYLVDDGHDVTIFHRGEHEIALPRVRHVHGEREHLGEVVGELGTLDVVLDMRAMTEADALATVRAFRGRARRLVAVSSSDVYRAYGRLHGSEPGPPDPIPLAEDAPLREHLYPYRGELGRRVGGAPWLDDYDKILVERVVLGDADLRGTILRLGFVHGPRSHRYFPYLKRVRDGRRAILIGESYARFRGTRAYSEDVARAIALSVIEERAAGRVYNVGEPEGTSEVDWLRYLAEAAGWDGEIVRVPKQAVLRTSLAPRLPDDLAEEVTQDLVIDSSRIRDELGYREHVPRSEGLRRTIEWMDANPPAADAPAMRGPFDYGAEDELLAALR